MVDDDSKKSGINHRKTIIKWALTFGFSLIFGIPTAVVAFIPVTWKEITPGLTDQELILFALATVVQVGGPSGNIPSIIHSIFKRMCFCLQEKEICKYY